MSNNFYNPSGSPSAQSRGASAAIRSEFALVAAGMQTAQDVVAAAINGAATYAVDSGAANAYVVTSLGVVDAASYITAYTDGLTLRVRTANPNTGAATLNVNALGAKTILRRDGNPLQAGDILATAPFTVTYNSAAGAFYLLMGLQGAAGATPNIQVGTTTTLAPGAAATLTNSGTTLNPVLNFGIPGSGAGQLLATLTPTVAANLDALSVFTGTYNNYRIYLEGLLPSATDALQVRLANAGAADAGSNYAPAPIGSSGTATVAAVPLPNTVNAGKGLTGYFDIVNANDTTNLKFVRTNAAAQNAATPGWTAADGLYVYVGAAVSGFRLYWSAAANFTATGKVHIYGYN